MTTLVLSALLVLSSVTAFAQSEDSPSAHDDVTRASRLYEEGTAAHAAGLFAEAARLFAQADELVPDASALEAALLAVLETDDAVLATRLATRTTREPFNEPLIALADRVRRRFSDRVGRVVVHCDDCEASVDGVAITPGIAEVVEAGDHEVTILVAGRTERRPIAVEPSSVVTLLPMGPEPPPPPVPSPAPPLPEPAPSDVSSAGPSPVWFWVGVGLTAAAAGGTIASAVDTAGKHADFEAEPTQALADAGAAAQLRTNALIGVTAGLAVITGAVGLFVVDWGGDDGQSTAALRLSVWPAGAAFYGTFP